MPISLPAQLGEIPVVCALLLGTPPKVAEPGAAGDNKSSPLGVLTDPPSISLPPPSVLVSVAGLRADPHARDENAPTEELLPLDSSIRLIWAEERSQKVTPKAETTIQF